MPSQPSDRHRPLTYTRARALRRPLTPAESVPWKHLRGRRLGGFKFRRQQPIGPYIADFFCAAASVVVELDGETHLGREPKDAARDEYLRSAGCRVLRFWNTAVFDELDAVIEAIWASCAGKA
ncbi:MAG: endonuclease domain-containing protein [Gemmataceae bacterium]|nr:endonuclease domain-containing protein [Gemmataceae bacterium]